MTSTPIQTTAAMEFEKVSDARVFRRGLAAEVAANRTRRPFSRGDGRVFLVAADFAGRGIIGAGDDPHALIRRGEMLHRIAQALALPEVDGVLATSDVVDDLLFLEGLRLENGLPSFLNDRLLVGSVNRGGTAGTVFEMDDTNTGHSILGAKSRGLDATKVMIRLGDEDEGSGRTLTRTAEIVRESANAELPVIVEIFPVRRSEGKWLTILEASQMAKMAVIAAALGDDTTYTWLKVPYCENFELVSGATSLPVTVLGGDSSAAGNIADTVAKALASGPTVRGAVVGRRALFPSTGTVEESCFNVGRVVHPGRR